MNLTALRAHVRDLTGFHLSSLVSDARVDGAINEAYAELVAAENWTWWRSAYETAGVSGNKMYTAPNASNVFGVAIVDGTKVTPLERVARQELEVAEERDEPASLFALATQPGLVWVWPTTQLDGKTVRIFFKYKAEKLVNGTDTPMFPEEYHTALSYGAAARLLVQENDDTPRAQAYVNEFGAVIERMRMAERSTGSQSFVMGSRPRERSRRYLTRGY